MATIAGCFCAWEDLDAHRAAALLDEYVAGDIDSMTVAQVRAAAHWLGPPIGEFPMFGDSFSSGVRGGIVSNNVYGMEFVGGIVIGNPHRNGTQTITMPVGNFTRFTGVQSPGVNDGSAVGATLSDIPQATCLWLPRV
jgi:hypothetical protein